MKPPTITGICRAFSEAGTEGVYWALHDTTKTGYEGLIILSNGDELTIYSKDNHDEIVWQGKVSFEYKTNYKPYPLNPQYGQQCVLNYWVHGLQRDVDAETWAKWFFEEYPATVKHDATRKSARK